jgi:hypothetical protein
MLLRRKNLVEGWQFTGPRSLDAAPAWIADLPRSIDRDPDQNDTTRDARLVLRDGRAEIMLYVGQWLIRHPDGTLEPMTDEQMQARFEPA